MRRRARHPIAAAVITIAVIAGVSYYAFNNGPPLVHGFRIHALMTDSNALRVLSPVRIAGINVGKVTSVESGPGATTKVNMELDERALPIHRDATLRVRPRLFVEGGYYVALAPGSPSAPPMKDGDTIPLPQTQSAVQLYQLLSTFQRPTRASLRNVLHTSAQALAHGGARGLQGASRPLSPALRDIAIVAQALRGAHEHDLSGLIAGTSRVTGALAADETALAGLVTNLDTTATALSARDGALGAGLVELARVMRAAPPALTAVDRALPALSRFARVLDPGLVDAPPLLRRLLAGVQEFGSLVAPAERSRLVSATRAALVSFPRLLIRLSQTVSTAKPITDCVVSHVVPVLTQEVPDGALSTGRPAWQDLAHLLPGIASAAQNFDGNGYALRYQSGTGPQVLSAGSLSGAGALTGAQPGGSPIGGARPVWNGRLQPSDFQPAQPCSAQPVTSLQADTGSAGLSTQGAGR
ncbi:MAG: phospholipid/cholesterol/gamma-HCH transport system substrate-binding protein [Solirubrobacteraceae bacterium]|nr:phospholipid/cholesterol/gamma-HCH transport system substrate-binding protein [Solirubrobacteraceae bacterium]